jgi:hypothetical protein
MHQFIDLYCSMLRVGCGSDPLSEAKGFAERQVGKLVLAPGSHFRRARIIEMWRDGAPVREISAQTGASERAVRRTIEDLREEVSRKVAFGR